MFKKTAIALLAAGLTSLPLVGYADSAPVDCPTGHHYESFEDGSGGCFADDLPFNTDLPAGVSDAERERFEAAVAELEAARDRAIADKAASDFSEGKHPTLPSTGV